MLASHLDAETRYSLIRSEALNVTTELLRTQVNSRLRATDINAMALSASKEWEQSNTRIKNWDWVEGYSAHKFRYPKRFEMALWNADRLIGLSMGRPTYHGIALRLDVVEAAPIDLGDRPPILRSTLLGYEIYGTLINARQIRIMHPVNQEVKSYYETYGYQYVEKGDYLFKDISPL